MDVHVGLLSLPPPPPPPTSRLLTEEVVEDDEEDTGPPDISAFGSRRTDSVEDENQDGVLRLQARLAQGSKRLKRFCIVEIDLSILSVKSLEMGSPAFIHSFCPHCFKRCNNSSLKQ